MYKNLRWKVLTIAVVFAVFFSVGGYPMLAEHYGWPCPAFLKAKALKLGLDLKGGVELRMRVNTDDALRTTTTSTSEQLRGSLATSNITPTITVVSPTLFRVEGVPGDRDQAFRAAADEVTTTD